MAEQLDLVTFDVSSAFLNTPARARNLREEHYGKRQVTIAAPPKSLIRLGVVDPGTLWEVLLAIYGLDTSPRDWSLHRLETRPTFECPPKKEFFSCNDQLWSLPSGTSMILTILHVGIRGISLGPTVGQPINKNDPDSLPQCMKESILEKCVRWKGSQVRRKSTLSLKSA